jgi:hypothetical protein
MKSTGLLIATFILAALVGALYWSDYHKPEETTTASADVPPQILKLTEADVTRLDLKKKGADAISLAKDSSGRWQITSPKPFRADQDAVSGVVATLSSLNSDRLIESKASDVGQYGLAQPSVEADVTLRDGKTQKLLIGDDLPADSGAYAGLAGDSRVFAVASYTKTSIDKNLNDLRDKRLLTVATDKVSRVELLTKKQDLEFGRNKDDWQILKPKPLRADSYQVSELIRKLTDAKMDLSVPQNQTEDQAKKAAAFASGTPVAVAKLTDESGTQELQVRKNKDDYYAKSSIVDGAYKVTSALGEGVDKGLDDFRNKKLFDFGYTDPKKIEMRDGVRAYVLTKGGDDWWSGNGKKLDAGSAQSFLDRVRDLSASKFPDTGFTTPVLNLTVLSNDGKRMEKVLISKAGDAYIAKRENEPALYQLESSAVSDLEKAVADLKEASPAKK